MGLFLSWEHFVIKDVAMRLSSTFNSSRELGNQNFSLESARGESQ